MSKFNWKNGTLIQNARVNVEGTMYDVEPAQFEGETPLSAENLNYMQDQIYEEIKKANTYSTEETVCGEWLGKPLYRKVFFGTLSSPVIHGLSNVNFVNSKAFYISSTGTYLPLASLRPQNQNFNCGYYVTNTQIVFDKSSDASGNVTVILEYTKTTD